MLNGEREESRFHVEREREEDRVYVLEEVKEGSVLPPLRDADGLRIYRGNDLNLEF